MLFIRHLKDNKLFKNYKDGVRNFLIVLGIKILKEKKKICKKWYYSWWKKLIDYVKKKTHTQCELI